MGKMKKPIDKDFDNIRDYMIEMEAYVKFLEETVNDVEEKVNELSVNVKVIEPLDITYFKGAVVEDDESCFQATMNVEGGRAYGFSVTYTDKRIALNYQKVEIWDDPVFFNMTLQGHKVDVLSLWGNYLFRDFLKELARLGWLLSKKGEKN
jgi:hypothetical protein